MSLHQTPSLDKKGTNNVKVGEWRGFWDLHKLCPTTNSHLLDTQSYPTTSLIINLIFYLFFYFSVYSLIHVSILPCIVPSAMFRCYCDSVVHFSSVLHILTSMFRWYCVISHQFIDDFVWFLIYVSMLLRDLFIFRSYHAAVPVWLHDPVWSPPLPSNVSPWLCEPSPPPRMCPCYNMTSK